MLFSIFVGLLIRYSIITGYTVFLIVYHKWMNESWGWVHMYLNILGNRMRVNSGTTLKFMVFYVIANVGMYAIFAFGSYCIVKMILFSMISLPSDRYVDFFFKTVFFSELFLFIFCRSRTSLRYFPLLSFMFTFVTMVLTALNVYQNVMIMLNINFSLQLILFTCFLIVEQ